MKKQLLIGAMLMGAFFTANAQNSCAEAAPLASGSIDAIDGDYYNGCWTAWGADDTADAAEWYMITATADGVYRINTNLPANEGGDTRIAVYTGDACDALTCWWSGDDVYFGGNGNPDNNYLTDFQFPVIEGETYYVAFDNQWGTTEFDFEATFMEPGCETTEGEFSEDWSNNGNFYFCWSALNQDDDATEWTLDATLNLDSADFDADPVAIIIPAAGEAKNDWLVSPGLNLVAGTEYAFTVVYNGVNLTGGIAADESFTVAMLNVVDETLNVVEEIGSEENIEMNGETLADLRDDALEGTYTFTPDADGEYFFGIQATSAADTGALMIFEVMADNTAGTNDVLASKFSVYPNPANNVINIANAENILVNGVVITDLNGRIVKNVAFDGVAEAQINVSDLASGMYMMTVSSDKGTMTKKIVKN